MSRGGGHLNACPRGLESIIEACPGGSGTTRKMVPGQNGSLSRGHLQVCPQEGGGGGGGGGLQLLSSVGVYR